MNRLTAAVSRLVADPSATSIATPRSQSLTFS
jgi:hypothetical protein